MPDASELKITPPFGYDEVALLRRTDRVCLPDTNAPAFCRSLNAIALSVGEFAVASRDYPIVFASADGVSGFSPVIVLGLADGQNLFVDDQGQWAADAYLPAFVRRYPFCISRIFTDGKPQTERVICVARSHVDPSGDTLYDADGVSTPQWASYEKLLSEFEKDLDFTAAMCERLAKLGLFSSFKFQIKQGDGTGLTLEGMYRINEARLAALTADQIKALVSEGLLGRVYTHLQTIENFTRLYSRAIARVATAATGTPNA